jgi:hypothetical protein
MHVVTEMPAGPGDRYDSAWRHRGRLEESAPTRMIAGLMIMGVGIVLVLVRLGLLAVDESVWPHLWPLLLIGAGLGKLLTPRPDGLRHGSGLLLIGIWLLLHELHVWRASDSWPLFLVAFGLNIVWNAVMGSARRPA